jgi:excisionase family DNA binding protein
VTNSIIHQFARVSEDKFKPISDHRSMTNVRAKFSDAQLPMLFTVEEVAEILRIGRSSVFVMIKRGELKSVKIGRNRRVPLESIHALVNAELSKAN